MEQPPKTNPEDTPDPREYFLSLKLQRVKEFLSEYTLLFRSRDADTQSAPVPHEEMTGEEKQRWELVQKAELMPFIIGGMGALGAGWTLGQVLKYSLFGWTPDASGVPRKDAAALKTFEDTYKATKDEGVIGGIAKGLGMAA